jgi:hypothetical protein
VPSAAVGEGAGDDASGCCAVGEEEGLGDDVASGTSVAGDGEGLGDGVAGGAAASRKAAATVSATGMMRPCRTAVVSTPETYMDGRLNTAVALHSNAWLSCLYLADELEQLVQCPRSCGDCCNTNAKILTFCKR